MMVETNGCNQSAELHQTEGGSNLVYARAESGCAFEEPVGTMCVCVSLRVRVCV